jgi:mRNA interferase RelE/StbE
MRSIAFSHEAAKELDNLGSPVRLRVDSALDLLAKDPLELRGQIKRLKGDTFLRLRVGDWRVIFDIEPDRIVILAIGHRSDIYR